MSMSTRGGRWSATEASPGVSIPSMAEATNDELDAAVRRIGLEIEARRKRRQEKEQARAMFANLDHGWDISIGLHLVPATVGGEENPLWRALVEAVRPVLEAAAR